MGNDKNMFYCCFLTSCDKTHRFRGLQEDFEKEKKFYSPPLFKNKLSVHKFFETYISVHAKIESVTLLLVKLRVFVDIKSYQIFH